MEGPSPCVTHTHTPDQRGRSCSIITGRAIYSEVGPPARTIAILDFIGACREWNLDRLCARGGKPFAAAGAPSTVGPKLPPRVDNGVTAVRTADAPHHVRRKGPSHGDRALLNLNPTRAGRKAGRRERSLGQQQHTSKLASNMICVPRLPQPCRVWRGGATNPPSSLPLSREERRLEARVGTV